MCAMLKQKGCNMVILYCTIAGFISAWAISGLLVIVDIVSNTPIGTFFSVIGVSIGIEDPVAAQYVGFGLHVLTGTAAGNIFGQITSIWNKVFPTGVRRGIPLGIIQGVALWIILFVPLATLAIQPKLDSLVTSDTNENFRNIALHFQVLYPVIVGGSLIFHIVYGVLLGFIVGRMSELDLFAHVTFNKNV